MSDDDEPQGFPRLEEVNEQLNSSLERCRDLLKQHRTQLAANANDPDGPDEPEEGPEP